ncbi:ferritin-like domain-containing protein [Archangium violaceum]|uniref:Ferritin n=1 Tax=Archangium violaceum Cb vi76 TaxID=1406225 RepID=A0A084SNF3_9BACT|nr:ferritin-like domain-containing protein [Archangium violaceum]KFA89988.1 ferritin [Archangium violaceum Cb vi76]
MDSPLLRRLFSRALRASLASPLVLAGCGGADLTGYSALACDDGFPTVSGLSPTVSPDFVQLRSISMGQDESFFDEVRRGSSGTACATASDRAACESALNALSSRTGFRSVCEQTCSAYYLATTRGDEVTALTTLEALKGYLGSIDTAQEAALLAFASNYNLSCRDLERGAVRANGKGGFNVIGTTGYACGLNTSVTQHVLEVSASGEVKEVSNHILERGHPNCVVGRRPVGLRASDGVACVDALGRHFALAAHLEAASIKAFLRLREELALHGADVALRDAALVSALEEVMHTDVSTRLARRFGATPQRPEVVELPLRSLFEVALENAVEGCVRETFGALVGHHQALHARDAEVREAMTRIAEDETRHAELSWAIDRWAREQLTAAECATLREAQREAVVTLREEVALPQDAALVTEAGVPTPEVAASLLATLEQELWA